MPRTHPSDSTVAITPLPELGTSESPQSFDYRCPVCGEMVDSSSAEQILLHHEHATHPRDFLTAKALLA